MAAMGEIQTLRRFQSIWVKSETELGWNSGSTQISENAFHCSDLPCLRSLLFNAGINKDGSKW